MRRPSAVTCQPSRPTRTTRRGRGCHIRPSRRRTAASLRADRTPVCRSARDPPRRDRRPRSGESVSRHVGATAVAGARPEPDSLPARSRHPAPSGGVAWATGLGRSWRSVHTLWHMAASHRSDATSCALRCPKDHGLPAPSCKSSMAPSWVTFSRMLARRSPSTCSVPSGQRIVTSRAPLSSPRPKMARRVDWVL